MSMVFRCMFLLMIISSHSIFSSGRNDDRAVLQYLEEAVEKEKKLEMFPADISFVILDLKYNAKDGVKICEIQPGGVSVFSGYDYLMGGDGLVPAMLCNALLKYQSQVWYMDNAICDKKLRREFVSRKWVEFQHFNALKRHDKFQSAATKPVKDPNDLYSYHGILYARPNKTLSLNELKKLYPGVIVLDAALFADITNKEVMDILLKSTPKLRSLRPVSKIYPKNKPPQELSDLIVNDIQGEFFVLKPIHSTKGQGVIIVERENLASTMEYIFNKDNRTKLSINPDRSYSYWAGDHDRFFLVEQFIESVYVEAPQFDSKLYDGTIRAVGLIIYNQQKVEFDLLEAHWKLPLKSISDEGSVTEKHKSYGNVPHFASVDPAIIDIVKQEIREGFEELYSNCK